MPAFAQNISMNLPQSLITNFFIICYEFYIMICHRIALVHCQLMKNIRGSRVRHSRRGSGRSTGSIRDANVRIAVASNLTDGFRGETRSS